MPHLGRNFANAERIAGVAAETIEEGSAIYGDDVAIAQRFIIGYAVYDNMIDRCTNARWKRACVLKTCGEAFEGRNGAVVADELLGQGVQLSSCDTRPHNFSYLSKCCADQEVGLAQQLDFFFSLENNHRQDR